MSDKAKGTSCLTTTQAAKLLSVSPDTVLKWAKAGKIRSFRTYGGHYRIPRGALEEARTGNLIKAAVIDDTAQIAPFQYCWEYLAGEGEISQDCKDCITYRSRSRRCYELRDLPSGLGCLGVFCSSTCNDCDYYQIVKGQRLLVMVLTESERILRNRAELTASGDLAIEFVGSEYEASALIESRRPDFVVVDCSLGRKRTSTVCRNLFNDPRIPVARVILASRRRNVEDYCDQGAFGWINKPFSVEQLRQCIDGVIDARSELLQLPDNTEDKD